MSVHPIRKPDPETLAQEQALRYARELRELYQKERDRVHELAATTAALERRQAELEALHAIDQGILGLAHVEQTFAVAAAAIARLVASDRVAILLYDPARDEVREMYAAGPPLPHVHGRPIEAEIEDAVRSSKPVATLIVPPRGPRAEQLADAGLRSSLAVPLVADGRVLGVLEVLSHVAAVHTAEEIDVVTRIAAQIAVALRSSQMRALERRRTVELEAIRRVSEAVGGSLDVAWVLGAAIDCSLDSMGLEWGAAYLVDPQDESVRLVAQRGIPADRRPTVEEPATLDPSIAGVVRDGRARMVPEHRLAEAGFLNGGWTVLPAVAAPLVWEGRVIGVLVLGSLDGRTPEEDDLDLLTELCRPVAAAVENAVLYGDLRRVDGTRKMLLTRLVQAQEEERTAIANDIHDDSVQVMTAVNMRLDLLRKQLQDPDERASLLGLAETVRAAINRLRRLMFELHPPALDRDGLAAVLRQSLQRVADEAGVVVTFEHRLACEPVAETRTIAYRIAQEALANIRKHARAQSVEMQLEEQGGGIITRIRDDGDGFDAGARADSPAGHLGLTAMRERAELAGGWLKIGSSPGAGTSVEFWLPQTGTGG